MTAHCAVPSLFQRPISKGWTFLNFEIHWTSQTQNNVFILTRFWLIKSKRRRPAASFSSDALSIPTNTHASHDEVLLPDLDSRPG
jgi:hypothetical protein